MASITVVESNRRIGGFFSNDYENDYVVTKDDGSCRRVFIDYKEAELYCNYLQQQETQERFLHEQRRTADELEKMRKAAEEHNRDPRFTPHIHPPYDPEYIAWKRQKDLQQQQERLRQERINREHQQRERTRLTEVAKRADAACSVTYNHDISTILRENIYTFTNANVVLDLAATVRHNFEFTALIKHYAHVPGFFNALLANHHLKDPLNADIVSEIIYLNKHNDTYLLQLLSTKYSDLGIYMTLQDNRAVLSHLLYNNLLPEKAISWVKDRLYAIDNKAHILKHGIINNSKDLEIAQNEFNYNRGSHTIAYYISLANKTKKDNIIIALHNDATSPSTRLTPQNRIDILLALHNNPNADTKRKGSVLLSLINLISERQQLEQIEAFCASAIHNSEEGSNFIYYKWLERMHDLGYLSERAKTKKIKQYYKQAGGSGCLLFIAIFTGSLIILFC